KIENNNNNMNFLIGTKDIETGIIILKNEAYVEKIKADKSFSVLVIKGAIKIAINNIEFVLKKHGMVVVEKEQEYEIKGTDGYTSSLFVSYSLK
ncbi:hypothetical protein COBT_000523, partial [Conglomerata obtusa]